MYISTEKGEINEAVNTDVALLTDWSRYVKRIVV